MRSTKRRSESDEKKMLKRDRSMRRTLMRKEKKKGRGEGWRNAFIRRISMGFFHDTAI